MAQVLIRDLDEATLKRLKKRAADNHRSLQGELRAIVTQVVAPAQPGEKTSNSLKVESPRAKYGGSAALVRERAQEVTPGNGARRRAAAPAGSVWNWLKRPAGNLSKEDIDAYIRAERDSWGGA